jgi:hypothetical protein
MSPLVIVTAFVGLAQSVEFLQVKASVRWHPLPVLSDPCRSLRPLTVPWRSPGDVCSGAVDQSLHFGTWTTNLCAAESLTDAHEAAPLRPGRSLMAGQRTHRTPCPSTPRTGPPVKVERLKVHLPGTMTDPSSQGNSCLALRSCHPGIDGSGE